MNRRLVVAVSVVVVGAAAAVVFASVGRRGPSHPHPASSGESAHGTGMDRSMSAYLALYRAPPGSTPCESAYNAFKASQDYATANQVTPAVLRLAPRDEFLQRCAALPPLTRKCLVPDYLTQHRPECVPAKPAADVLAPMIALRVRGEESPDPDETPPSPSGTP